MRIWKRKGIAVDKYGIEFYYKGDIVIWSWWWRPGRKHGKYISLGFSGTGEFGDARFHTLKELDREWESFYKACDNIKNTGCDSLGL